MTLKTPESLYSNIDWELLKSQKSVLLDIILKMEVNKDSEKKEVVAMYGILNLIDAIQDIAVKHFRIDKNIVFDFTKDEDE